jgi:hypothetical protein
MLVWRVEILAACEIAKLAGCASSYPSRCYPTPVVINLKWVALSNLR